MKIGILGAGQLGRMLAQAGHELGMEFRFLDPAREISARGMGEHLCEDWADETALAGFAEGLDLVTYEFENVPDTTADFLAALVPLYPSAGALKVAQDRLFEKNYFREHGAAVPPFEPIPAEGARDAMAALLDAGALTLPMVIKTRRFGYDGKGQCVARTREEAISGAGQFPDLALIAEQFVPFDGEASLIAARGRDGAMVFYPLVENHHRGGILRLSLAPAPIANDALQAEAEAIARRVMEALDYVGVLAIEFFIHAGGLLVNEMAPRVHNSGHWTIEGAETSQFANHMRAIAGLPLGPTTPKGHAAMVNVIGDFPDEHVLARVAGMWQVHDYGKSPRAGRKLGHLTTVHPTAEARDHALEMLADAGVDVGRDGGAG